MTRHITLLVLFVTVLSVTSTRAQEFADMIIWNGKIITVDSSGSIAQAVAVKDSLILAVGTNAEIASYQGPQTDMRNLNGKTVTPGMIDAHLHLMYYGQAENDYVNLRHTTSIAEVVTAIGERAKQTPKESGSSGTDSSSWKTCECQRNSTWIP